MLILLVSDTADTDFSFISSLQLVFHKRPFDMFYYCYRAYIMVSMEPVAGPVTQEGHHGGVRVMTNQT